MWLQWFWVNRRLQVRLRPGSVAVAAVLAEPALKAGRLREVALRRLQVVVAPLRLHLLLRVDAGHKLLLRLLQAA